LKQSEKGQGSSGKEPNRPAKIVTGIFIFFCICLNGHEHNRDMTMVLSDNQKMQEILATMKNISAMLEQYRVKQSNTKEALIKLAITIGVFRESLFTRSCNNQASNGRDLIEWVKNSDGLYPVDSKNKMLKRKTRAQLKRISKEQSVYLCHHYKLGLYPSHADRVSEILCHLGVLG
jgi:hypothetical protein